jgi:hypothetical protein
MQLLVSYARAQPGNWVVAEHGISPAVMPRRRGVIFLLVRTMGITSFAAQYARVRSASAEALEHAAIEETYEPVADLADAAARRLRVDTLKWAAGKRNPKTHGDKLLHTGADGESAVAVKLALDYTLLNTAELLQLQRLIEKATPKPAGDPLQIEGEVIEESEQDA